MLEEILGLGADEVAALKKQRSGMIMTDRGYHDIVIRGATVIDGSGAAGYLADVAVSGGRIADVGELSGLSGTREIEATGRRRGAASSIPTPTMIGSCFPIRPWRPRRARA